MLVDLIVLLGAAAYMQKVVTKLVMQLSLTDTAVGLGQVQAPASKCTATFFFPLS